MIAGSHFIHRVPREISGFDREVEGRLYLSQTGYIHAAQARPVLRIKLLGLAVSLPIRAIVNKIIKTVRFLFGAEITSRGAYDFSHMLRLSGIAWKGVVGWKKTLAERASQFALAELDSNFEDRAEGMSESRSERLKNGYYAAPCLHPICKQEDYSRSSGIDLKNLRLQNKLGGLIGERKYRQKTRGTLLQRLSAMGMERIESYTEMDDEALSERITRIERLIEQNNQLSGRVKKYADIAVVRQQGCLRIKAAASRAFKASSETISSALVEETAKVDCCGTTCYREKRICCCVYQIECCEDFTCWAIDCICCMLCFSPATGDCCLVA